MRDAARTVWCSLDLQLALEVFAFGFRWDAALRLEVDSIEKSLNYLRPQLGPRSSAYLDCSHPESPTSW